ncbi:unnamed protein product [Dovyalis caffra]|uniref:Uncharacterized protein n=1 Tax=Dovyalis caffra TaxID=77055 RepID=A0AAV1R3Y8_9ROSI|nr:unnamed protein product [Dovyalis caffra]
MSSSLRTPFPRGADAGRGWSGSQPRLSSGLPRHLRKGGRPKSGHSFTRAQCYEHESVRFAARIEIGVKQEKEAYQGPR